jgi:transposase
VSALRFRLGEEVFGVSLFFVEKWSRRHCRSGALEPDRKRAGQPVQIDAAARKQVQRWLEQQSDLTLAALADRLHAGCGLQSV